MRLRQLIILFLGIILAVFWGSGKILAGDSFPVIPHLAEAPVIDGDLSEAVWSHALAVQLHYADADTPGEPDNPTTVYAFTAKENGQEYIYFAFKCIENHPDGPFIADPEHKATNRVLLDVSDFVRVRASFGRWGRFAYYLFESNTANTGYASGYYAFDSWRKAAATAISPPAIPYQPLPSYKSCSKIFTGYWSAEIKVNLRELILYPGEGIPKYMELEFFRERVGDDRIKMAKNSGDNSDPDALILFDEYPQYWKYFYNYVQSWTRMTNPYRFCAEVYMPAENRVYNEWSVVTNPLWFKLVVLEAGTIENKLVCREDTLPSAFFTCCNYVSLGYTQEERNRLRIEWWEDTTPVRPAWKADPPLIQTAALEYGQADFADPPQAITTDEGALISFTVEEYIDVAVAILNSEGKIIRHLASGVLGANPPAPFKPNFLAQEILWDWKDDEGEIVPQDNYKVKVYLGLTLRFGLLLPKDPEVPEYEEAYKSHGISWSQLSKDLKLGTTEPGNASGRAMGSKQTIYVDRKTEEVYIGGYFIYDGITGSFLRQAELCEKLPADILNPELVVGPDDNWWLTGWCDLRRYDKNGNKAPWDLLQSHILPQIRRGHDNPHRGHCFGGPDNDCYIVHHYDPHGNPEGVITQIGSDARIKQWGIVEIPAPTQCVKVDREGYIYTSCVLQPKGRILIPSDFAPVITDEMNEYFKEFYGSVVKFSPQGGKIISGDGNYLLWGRNKSILLGAEWVHPWISPLLTRAGKFIHCNCESSRFDLDPFERLWIPDGVRSRIEITDKNANTIKIIGDYGLLENSNGEDIYFGFPMAISVSDKAGYVGDFFYRQGIKLDLTYKQEAGADINYIEDFTIITPPSLPQIIQGENISIRLETINGSEYLHWQVIGGSLPPGVSIDPDTGIISGTPTQAGVYTFTLAVQDSALQGCTKTFTMIAGVPPELTLLTDTLYNAILNQPYYYQLSAEGGIPPYTWSIISGSLPDGLKLNTEAGYIYGTSPRLQSSSFEIQLKDSTIPVAKTASKNFSITVKQGCAGDYIAPEPIKDLKAASANSTYLTLSWSATGDDETQGYASAYDLRYSTNAVSDSALASEKNIWWEQAKKTVGLPIPKAFGSSEQFIIYNLIPSTTYYFAIKAIDESENVSGISNIAYAETKPQPIIETVKIRAQCSGQGCYNSLSQWQAQYLNRDLVGQNKILIVECYNDWPQGLNDHAVITGWATDPDHYIKIMAAPGHQTNGMKNSGFRMFQSASQSESATLEITNWYVKLQGIEIENKNKGVALASRYSNYLEIEGCLLEADGIGTCYFPWPVFYQDYQCGYLKIWNTIVRQKNPARDCFKIANYQQEAFLYNVMAEGGAIGFNAGSGQAVLKNCVAYNNTIGFNGNVSADSTNNASWDNSVPGQNPQTGVSASDFMDAAGNNYRIAESSSKLRNKGIDLSADLYIAFTTDITGSGRGQEGNWDIGVYEFLPSILNGDINGDNKVNVLDVQACVNVILGVETDADRIKAAKAAAEPMDKCDVLDVQKIVNLILKL